MAARLFAWLFALVAGDVFAGAQAAPLYTLRYEAKSETVAVRLCLPQAAARVRFAADSAAPRYIDKPARSGSGTLIRDDDGWSARDWQAGECLSYRAALGRIADAARRSDGVRRSSDLVSDPHLWLLQAEGADAAELRVELPIGYALSAPWTPLPASDGALHYRIAHTPDDWMARVAIGRFAESRIELTGGVLRVAILDGANTEQRAKLADWLGRVSRAAVSAYGRLPLADVQVLVVPVGAAHEPVVFGQSTRGQGHALTLFVDPAQPASAFEHDWVAVHELSHLFHPYLGDRGSWLAEGLATYYQNVLRARAGLLTDEEAWEQIDAGFARGRRGTPAHAELDLEQAAAGMGERHDFMRIYWSGTAYWLGVDVELRRASANRLSVDEALKRFDACCLTSVRRWEPADFVAKLDALLGTDVFVRRFGEFRARHDFPDTVSLLAALGIHRNGDALRFDAGDDGMRRAIMAAPPNVR